MAITEKPARAGEHLEKLEPCVLLMEHRTMEKSSWADLVQPKAEWLHGPAAYTISKAIQSGVSRDDLLIYAHCQVHLCLFVFVLFWM